MRWLDTYIQFTSSIKTHRAHHVSVEIEDFQTSIKAKYICTLTTTKSLYLEQFLRYQKKTLKETCSTIFIGEREHSSFVSLVNYRAGSQNMAFKATNVVETQGAKNT